MNFSCNCNISCNCNKVNTSSAFINNCAGYGFCTKSNNVCPPKAPWWDDGEYPDYGDFGNMYPGFNPWNTPNTSIPLVEFIRPRNIDQRFIATYSGYNNFKPYPCEYNYNIPQYPYHWPNRPVIDLENKCCKCCEEDKWECDGDKCFDEYYYGRCK